MSRSQYCQFIVNRIERASQSAHSFYLVAQAGEPLEPFLPGQHLQFRLHLPNNPVSIQRFYTLSDCANGRYYRLSIKREAFGQASQYFHDALRVGDILEAKAPTGDFHLDTTCDEPVVLIAGGIGVTPMISMVNHIAAHQHERIIHFFYALRSGSDHAFKAHLNNLKQTLPNLNLQVFYETPRQCDRLGEDYDQLGRINLEVLKQHLPHLEHAFFICGPGPMMDALVGALTNADVPSNLIHTESFGPAATTVDATSQPAEQAEEIAVATTPVQPETQDTAVITVTFAKSGRTESWNDNYTSLLQFAEGHDIEIDAGCLFGDCATCMTPILEGEVEYNHPTSALIDEGACLPCSARPMCSLTLDI